MNTQNKTNYTLLELLECEIQIPVIQRDYVQGCALNAQMEEKRDDFVRKLLNALLPTGRPYNLDFVYGAPEIKGGAFLPLDGQQRLTTLFLLHWILLQMVEDCPDRLACLRKLTGFSYKTRISSDRFCRKICVESFSFDGYDSLEAAIKDKNWYVADIAADPTVKAMMQMVAVMEKMLKEKPYCENLNVMCGNLLKGRRITFDLLNMVDYHLTDGLYVKMNARGKELTPFENRKADLIAFFSYDAEVKDHFTDKIEHDWNDLFWSYAYEDYEKRNNAEREKVSRKVYPRMDERFMSFFNNMLRLMYFVNYSGKNEAKAGDYKPGVWEQVAVVLSNARLREFLFGSLDWLYKTHKEYDGGLPKFFSDVFYTNEPVGRMDDGERRVRLFVAKNDVDMGDGNVDLFNLISRSSEDFRSEHIMLYALLLYCVKFDVSVVDNDLLGYIRKCRNYLLELKQQNTAKVTVESNVRVNNMNAYLDNFVKFMNEGDVATESIEVGCLRRNIEDMDYVKGCIEAFEKVFELCGDGKIKCNDVWDAMQAFRLANAVEKVQLFIAFGYRGKDFGDCNYGKRIFMGCDTNTKDDGVQRWEMHFRMNGGKLAPWVEKYVTAFAKVRDVKTLISQAQKTVPHSVADYMLRYPEIVAAQVYKRKDLNGAPFYYAMPNPWNDFDIIVIHSFSSRPLIGYNICPMVNAVFRRLSFRDEGVCWYEGLNSQKEGIRFHDKDDNEVFSFYFFEKEWYVWRGFNLLSPSLRNLFAPKETDDNGDEYWNMLEQPGKDLIEQAVDFLEKVYLLLKKKKLI
jgi:hypothetical protein